MKEDISKLEQALHIKEAELVNLKNAAVELEQKSEDVKRSCSSEVVCDSSTFFAFIFPGFRYARVHFHSALSN